MPSVSPGVSSDSSPVQADFRPDINALRALAVMSVIFYHFDMLGATSGFIGVDVFFVISGFLIGGQISAQIGRGEFRLSAFITSRIRRIVPALVVVCVAVYLWGWLVILPRDYKVLVRFALTAVAFVSNIAFAGREGYFDPWSDFKPLLHTWSLSVEAQFYVLLPFFLMLVHRLRAGLRASVTLALVIASFAAAIALGSKSPDKVFFSFNARAWELLLGCLTAWFAHHSMWYRAAIGDTARKGLIAANWAALIAACFLLPKGAIWPGPWTLVPVLLAAVIILLGSTPKSGQLSGPLVRNPMVQHVGTISYSLYLWHWPLIAVWKLMDTQNAEPSALALCGLLVTTWVLAFLSWRFVESPFRSNKAFWNTRRIFSAYVAVVALFAVVGTTIWKLDGVPARITSLGANAVSAEQFRIPPYERCWSLPRKGDTHLFFGCDFGNPNLEPTFVIWGDSHGGQYLEALRELMDNSSMSGYLLQGPLCEPAFPDMPKGGPCDVHNEEALKRIESTSSVKTIVVSIRQNDPVRTSRTVQTAKRLLDKGYTVVFLGPLPKSARPFPQDWLSEQVMKQAPVNDVTMNRDTTSSDGSYNERLATWQAAITPLMQAYPNKFVAIDLTDMFCDATKCWLARNKVGLFRDDNHLNTAGARVVLPALLKAVATRRS